MLNQVFQVCRLVLFLLLGADRTKLVLHLHWGLFGSHSDVVLMLGLRVILCECKSSCLSLLRDWEIDNKVLDAVIETELGENIFGPFNVPYHALSFRHPSELPFH